MKKNIWGTLFLTYFAIMLCFNIIAVVEDTKLRPTVEIQRPVNTEQSENFLLKKDALYQDDKGYYCMGIEEKNVIHGKEFVTYRIKIKLIKEDQSEIIVKGAFSSVDSVVIHSDKKLGIGQRVRIKGQEESEGI